MYNSSVFLFLLLTLFLPGVIGQHCRDPVCEFTLILRTASTMTYRNPETGTLHEALLNGTTIEALIPEASGTTRRVAVDSNDVITGNGVPGPVLTINHQFPGPLLEVDEGARVKVHVVNLLTDKAGSIIHFHGIFMRNRTWYDGVQYVSHRPARQGQALFYDFIAEPTGTHWYHSHFPHQHRLGLLGMFLVHRRELSAFPPPRTNIPMIVSDWNNQDILTNGRGRADERLFPLSEFPVRPGSTNRFRVLNAGDRNPISISFDDHKLRLRAVDGFEIQPVVVDEIVLHVAERVDVELVASEPVGRYWVRSRSPPFVQQLREGRAILHYEGTKDRREPETQKRRCTQGKPCVVFNCIRREYPPSMFTHCVHVDHLRSNLPPKSLADIFNLHEPIGQEIFLQPSVRGGMSINRKSYRHRAVAYYEGQDNHLSCNDVCLATDDICHCPHEITLPYNQSIDLIMFTRTVAGATASPHPMHLHGHNLAILAVGYARINPTTGATLEPNKDIECESDTCLFPRWVGNRSEHNFVDPPVKDVIVVPADGYVVARIRSDNPGAWFYHCHIGSHVDNGMALVFKEAQQYWPPAP